ncbi:MAG: hypothetical protein EPO26_17320 [Chloroflexota bacterium]|nr:MAG: hypothetical protein EPO26_17320 [Chloroflexota bacterium]
MDQVDDEFVFSAGQPAPPGTYIRIDIWVERRIVLDEEAILPASCDGRVAVYRLVPALPEWLSIQGTRTEIALVA